MILGRVVYNAQFSFVTIYKVGKCMMPGVLKICSDFKSRVVHSSLKVSQNKTEQVKCNDINKNSILPPNNVVPQKQLWLPSNTQIKQRCRFVV